MKTTLIPRAALLALMILTLCFNGLEAQNPRFKSNGKSGEDTNVLALIKSYEKEGCSVLEVSEEMFDILSQDERASAEMKESLSQIDHLIYLNCFTAASGRDTKNRDGYDLAGDFQKEAADYDFKLLMRSETTITRSHFYKRTKGETNEYLLITKTTIQYIATEMNIMSIRELKDIIEMAGDAGGL